MTALAQRWLRGLALAASALLVACAGPGDAIVRGRLHYGMTDAPEGDKLMWPAAPEVPRFVYAGTLVGESNFLADGRDRGALREFGRWLAGLDEGAASPLVLQRPTALVGDDTGRLYVSDTGRQAVFVFDEGAGEMQVWDRAAQGQPFVAPAGVAVGRGRVFVADAERGSVSVLDLQGEPIGSIGKGALQRPTGVARDARLDVLYVADSGSHDVKVFDAADGRLLLTIGRRGDGPGEFNLPSHLAFVRGELYVTDTLNSRVQVFDAEGRWLRSVGARGLVLGNLVRPKGVSVDAEGNLYVIESYFDSLLVYTRDGEFLMPIGGTGKATGRFYLPSGVWVDARNRVYIADMFNGRVVLFQFLGS